MHTPWMPLWLGEVFRHALYTRPDNYRIFYALTTAITIKPFTNERSWEHKSNDTIQS